MQQPLWISLISLQLGSTRLQQGWKLTRRVSTCFSLGSSVTPLESNKFHVENLHKSPGNSNVNILKSWMGSSESFAIFGECLLKLAKCVRGGSWSDWQFGFSGSFFSDGELGSFLWGRGRIVCGWNRSDLKEGRICQDTWLRSGLYYQMRDYMILNGLPGFSASDWFPSNLESCTQISAHVKLHESYKS